MSRPIFSTIFLLVVTAGALAQGASSDTAPVLSLQSAINQAQQHNRLIAIAGQSVLFANDEILAAKTQRYPHFNVQLTGSELLSAIDVHIPKGVFGFVGTTPVPSTNSVITTEPKPSALSIIQVEQPLSQLWNAHLNIDLLKVGKKLSQEQEREQRQQITASVKQTYYSLLQAQSALDAAQENLQALREVDRTTEQFVQEKAALPYQSAGVKVQLAQAELQIVTLQDNMGTLKESLNNLMGRDIRSDFRVNPIPEALPEEQSLQLARQSAVTNRTEIHQAQLKIDQAVFARRLQKAQYIPEISGQYLFFSPFSVQGLPNHINSIGIVFKWDLYDWGYKRHLLDEKDRNIEQSRLNLTETQSQVVIDLDNRFRKLREARANLKVAQLAQEAEQQKLQVVLEQYKQKATLLSSLQTEQASMAQASSQYQQALANFWTARSDFEKSLGED
jgi:outer membrane protein